MGKNIDLSRRVREALANSEDFKNCMANIYVIVNDGAVILTGAVDRFALKETAENIAANVPGVDAVIEDLKVEYGSSNRIGIKFDWAKNKMAVLY